MPAPVQPLITCTPVQIIDACNLSETTFRLKYRSRNPVVIRGIAPSDLGMDVATLLQTLEDPAVLLAHDNANFIDNDKYVSKRSANNITFADISQVCSKQKLYLRSKVPGTIKEKLGLSVLEKLADIKAFKDDLMRLWLSSSGCITPLHYDRCHGTLIQLSGTKRFVIFAGDDTRRLYPCDGINGPTHASRTRYLGRYIDSHPTIVLQQWPKLRDAEPWVVDLQPGDLLYTPPGYVLKKT
jgi:ribosomal protein L16 Arg81 hydroxylase